MTELQKCSRCRVSKLLSFFSIRENTGERFKTCQACRSETFKCDQCQKDFSSKINLRSHIKDVHDKIKQFACSSCEVKISRNSSLKLHIKAVHDKILDIECNVCEYKCSDNGNLQRHIKSSHDKIRDIECNLCEYKSSDKGNFQRHRKICTGKLNISGGELAVRKALELLDGLNNYSIQYKTEICAIPNSQLRFDFEVIINGETKYIEYDGEQHFKPVRFGGNQEQAEFAFQKLQKT